MSRVGRQQYWDKHAVIAEFIESLGEACGGNLNEVVSGCATAMLSVLSAIHRGNSESVALNFEQLLTEIAEQVREGALELGENPS